MAACAGHGGAAGRGLRPQQRARVRRGRRQRAGRLPRTAAAHRVRSAFDRLPARKRPACPGARPFRHPQGRPRGHLRLPRSAVRTRCHRSRAAAGRAVLAPAAGAGRGDGGAAEVLAVLLPGRRSDPAPAAQLFLQRPLPLLLGRAGAGAGRADPVRQPGTARAARWCCSASTCRSSTAPCARVPWPIRLPPWCSIASACAWANTPAPAAPTRLEPASTTQVRLPPILRTANLYLSLRNREWPCATPAPAGNRSCSC